MSIVNLEFLVTNDFERRQYPDGWFWLLKVHDELFLQVEELNNRVTLWQDGWVDDYLTDEELIITIQKLKAMKNK